MKGFRFHFLIAVFCSLSFAHCYDSKQNNDSLQSLLTVSTVPIRVTVVGDSIAQLSDGFGLKAKLPNNYSVTDVSIAGYNISSWLENSSHIEGIPTDIWIVELGTNDALSQGTYKFRENYSELLNRLELKNPSFIVLSTVPLTEQVGIQTSVRENNETIRNLAGNKATYRLADLEKLFSNHSGQLLLYSVDDPIHPNQIGMEMIGEEYRKLLLGL